MPHLTVPEIAARMGVSTATAKRRIAEWTADTGISPMRPGRSIILTESEFSEMLEFTRNRVRGGAPAPAPVPAPARVPGQSRPSQNERQHDLAAREHLRRAGFKIDPAAPLSQGDRIRAGKLAMREIRRRLDS